MVGGCFFFSFLTFFFFLWGRISLCSLVWCGTHQVDQVDLDLTETHLLLLPACWGQKVCTTTPASHTIHFSHFHSPLLLLTFPIPIQLGVLDGGPLSLRLPCWNVDCRDSVQATTAAVTLRGPQSPGIQKTLFDLMLPDLWFLPSFCPSSSIVGRVCFNSELEGTVRRGGKAMAAGAWDSSPQSSQYEAVMDVCTQLTVSFLFSLGPQCVERYHTHFGQNFPPELPWSR